MNRYVSFFLVLFQVIVFNTHSFTWAATGGMRDQNALPSDLGLVSFNAVTATQVNPYTGQAELSVPLFVPPGRKGLQPTVQLCYSSAAGNGICGKGWAVPIGSIERSVKRGVPSYTDSDTFILNFNGSTELAPIGSNDYRAVHESRFFRVRRVGDAWEVTDKGGTIYYFGSTVNARQADPGNRQRIFSWHLEKVIDVNGNYMTYSYEQDAGQMYPSRIDYNGHEPTGLQPTHHVYCIYESRPDVRFSYRTNYRVTVTKRLSQVDMTVGDSLARRYVLTYTMNDAGSQSLLANITEIGSDGVSKLNPISFSYTTLDHAFMGMEAISGCLPKDIFYASFSENYTDGGYYRNYVSIFDMNRDGLIDRVMKQSSGSKTVDVQYLNRSVTQLSAITRLPGYVLSSSSSCRYLRSMQTATKLLRQDFVDVNADGFPDRVYNDTGKASWSVQLSNGAGFNAVTAWAVNDLGAGTTYDYLGGNLTSGTKPAVNRLYDMTGDGYPDRVMQKSYGSASWWIQRGTGSGFCTPEQWPITVVNGINDFSAVESTKTAAGTVLNNTVVDLNGDGLPDRVIQPSATNTWQVQFNTGTGFAPVESWGGLDAVSDSDFYYLRNFESEIIKCDLVDMNSDGLPDCVMQPSTANSAYKVQLNTGSGFAPVIDWRGILVDGTARKYAALGFIDGVGCVWLTLCDINGDGLPERAIQKLSSLFTHSMQRQSGSFPDLLKTVHNGRGASTTFAYTPSTRYDNTGDDAISDLGFPVQVVSSVTTTDALGRSFVATYSYEGGMYDYAAREFRGFGTVTVCDPAGVKTVSRYHQDTAMQGRVYSREIYAADGRLFSRVHTTWDVIHPVAGSDFVYLAYEDEYTYEGTDEYRRRRTGFAYDQYGNLACTIEYGEYYDDSDGRCDVAGDERMTVNTYVYRTTPWIVNTIARTEWQNGAGTVVGAVEFYYDDAVSVSAQPVTGRLTKEVRWNDGGPDSETVMTYDGFGNIVTVTDGLGNVTANAFDETYHQFVERIVNARGHVRQFRYDALLGKVIQTVDPNDAATETVYDCFGRVVKVIEPGDSTEYPTQTMTYREYQSSGVLERVRIDLREAAGTGDVLTSYSFSDGLGRTVQTRVESADPLRQRITGAVVLDGRGLVAEQYIPYFEAAGTEYTAPDTTKPKTTGTYDPLQRPVVSVLPDGSETRTEYGVWAVTTITDTADHSNEQKTKRLLDAFGRCVEVQEFNDLQQYCTRYAYDTRDHLVRVTDENHNVTTIEYDSLGRKIRMDDPDTGVTAYTYDRNGNLLTQTDANGEVITFTYDELNRMMQKDYADPGTPDVTFVYDSYDGVIDVNMAVVETQDPASLQMGGTGNCIGRCTGMVNEAQTIVYAYDRRGRVIVQSYWGGMYCMIYDPMGRVTDLQYPTGMAVHYAYDSGGGIARVGLWDGDDLIDGYFVQQVDYNASGMMTRILYGNGVATNYTYDQETLRLHHLITKDATAQVIQDLNYTFDNNSNVTSITDDVNTGSQEFVYDGLNRLIRATGSYGVIEYAYDAIGNMIAKGDVAFTIGGGSSGPHQVVASSDGRTFTYDACGNMTRRGYDTLQYDAEHRLVAVERSCEGTDDPALNTYTYYRYGADGGRILKDSGDAVSMYCGSSCELRDQSLVVSVRMGDVTIAEVVNAGTVYFMHTDHLRSTNVITDQAGSQIHVYEYAPFGTITRDEGPAAGSSSTDYGTPYAFTGQERDADAGLYYYHARYYDPELGRFIQPDSVVQSPYDPQTLNRYSYCRNNPVKFVDPSGHFWGIIIAIFAAAGLGAVSAGIQSGWNSRAMLVGAGIGIVAGAAGYAVGGVVGSGLGIVEAGSVAATWMSAVAGGVAAGVVAGGLTTAYYGGDLLKGILIGAGMGALGGTLYGGIGLIRPDNFGTWGLVRVALSGAVGGGMSELAGGSFWEGVAFSSAIAGSNYLYKLSMAVSGADPQNPSLRTSDGSAGTKPNGKVSHGNGSWMSDVGVGDDGSVPFNDLSLLGKVNWIVSSEQSPVMRAISLIPAMDPMAEMHDPLMSRVSNSVSGWRFEMVNKFSIAPAYAATAIGSLCDPVQMGLYEVYGKEL